MPQEPTRPGARTWFALGCSWALLIVIVLIVLAFLLVLWWLGFIGPTD
jgi:hypothetical protein